MKRNCDNCIFAQRSGGCVSWDCEPIPIREAERAWKEAKELKRYMPEITVEETKALNDLYVRALDPEWQRAHRAIGFSSPIADLYDTLEELAKERSEEGEGDERSDKP